MSVCTSQSTPKTKKVVFRAFLRPCVFAASGGFRSARRHGVRLPKQAYTYVNPRYDTSNPLWRPVAPRGRSIGSDNCGDYCASQLPPTVEAYHGRFDDVMANIDEPCGSMMNKLEDIKELRAALHKKISLQFPKISSSPSPSSQ